MIDLRSDTITVPGPEMRQAMASAKVGDDVFGEDPTVHELEETTAGLLGKQAALFVPSGVMANQTAIKAQTSAGDEVVVEETSHILLYESGAAPVLSGVQLRTVKGENGLVRPSQVEYLLRGEDVHVAPVRLICLENTHNKAGGRVLPLDGIRGLSEFAQKNELRLHMDGARLWNAAVALGVRPAEIARYVDSVAVCFSKGLGAPVGSAIAGPEPFIRRCRKIRKMLGGGMRQAGIIAAGALYAVRHQYERLREDHDHARAFAGIIAERSCLLVDLSSVQTNIVIMDVSPTGLSTAEIISRMQEKGVRFTSMDGSLLRAVTHCDVSKSDVLAAAELLAGEFPSQV